MSARKRKQATDVQPIFDAIQDALINLKPKLAERKRSTSRPILDELHKIATLAESFTQQRPRTNKDWLPLADALDREGVQLWNASGQVREDPDDASRAVFATLRLAGFRLIEAGLEQRPSIETLIHVLQLASKTGASLSEIGGNDVAASVLTCAAKYEEDLKIADDEQGVHQQAKARATILYYSSRMEAAWREGNDGVADFMLQKITETPQHLTLVPSRDRVSLAAKILEIGKSFLRNSRDSTVGTDPGKAQDSVKWVQKAFAIVEQTESSETSGQAELKRSILRTLARAYFLASAHDPDNLSRAETTLNELISSIDGSLDRVSPEYQQLRWMRVAILKRRKAGEPHLIEAFQSIIDHLSFGSENHITDILQELKTLGHYQGISVLVTSVHQHALRKALETEDRSGHRCADRLLLSLLFHCSRDENHARAMHDINAAFTCLNSADYALPKVPTTACLTDTVTSDQLLWQFGDRQYNTKRWSEAADWFLSGTHEVFDSMAHTSKAKCFRKAALCYLQHGDYSRASVILRRCPLDEATTHYVVLLTATRQGLEDEAIKSIEVMVKCPDFDQKMLLLATQLANESDMKTLLLSVLEALFTTLDTREGGTFEIEALTLIRCIIRLVLKLLAEPIAKKSILIPTLIRHFRTANTLLDGFHVKKRATIVAKDVSWLWRTAYNCAVQGCSEWENSEQAVSDLFDISRKLLEIYSESALSDIDAELSVHMTNASFAAIAGRMFALRSRLVTEAASSDAPLTAMLEEIGAAKSRIQRVIDNGQLPSAEDTRRVQSFIHVLRVFEAELSCLLREWKRLLVIINEAAHSDGAVMDTFEAIADIVWVERDCPVEVLFSALEAILHASLDRMSLSVKKFSRWLRAISTILLSRNTPNDRAKAIGYVEQAVAVLEEYSEAQEDDNSAYPIDERQWLLGTAYNTGIECLHASLVDEAKRWFEASTVICRFVPDGNTRAEKIAETYTHLLDRYTRNSPEYVDLRLD